MQAHHGRLAPRREPAKEVGSTMKPDAISQAVALIAEHAPAWDQTAVVVSAMRGVTDALIEGAVTAARGDDQTYRGIVSDLRVRHTLEVAGLLADPLSGRVFSLLS